MLWRVLVRVVAAWSLAVVWLAAGSPGRADSELDRAVLKKVKAATAHLGVTLSNGDVVEGTGFFTDKPGLVLTNAHVMGMMDAESRPPTRIDVTIRSGEADSQTLTGKLIGVDRDSDLALLRVTGTNLPEVLKVVPAKDLVETQEVFIFGFPLGRELGKNITVSRSSVSSLRSENGQLKQVQVNGGMHPGNSGGPVTNAKGEVIGVAVSGISGTQIHFAIPGEVVHGFLNGKVVTLAADLGYKDGERVKMPFRIIVVDPLGRLRQVHVETWVGEPGNRRRPGGKVKPKPLPGDSPRETVDVPYRKQSLTSIELSLPREEDPKKVYWIQPNYVNGAGESVWFPAFAPRLGAPVTRREITLAFQPRLNHRQLTELVSEGSFRVRAGTVEHSLQMNFKHTLSEQTAESKAGEVLPIHVNFQNFALSLFEDKKLIKGDAETNRLARNIRAMSANVDMEADGNMGRSKLNMGRMSADARELLEPVGDQALQVLELVAVPLPGGSLRPLQTWKVQRNILLGSALLGVRAVADVKYTYFGTRMLNNREIAFLNVSGAVRAERGAGLEVTGTVDGGTQVALDTGEVLSATMNLKADMDLEYKNRKSKLFGTLTVRVRRDLPAAPPKPAPKKN
jgi:hypothetical protein